MKNRRMQKKREAGGRNGNGAKSMLIQSCMHSSSCWIVRGTANVSFSWKFGGCSLHQRVGRYLRWTPGEDDLNVQLDQRFGACTLHSLGFGE